MATDATTELEDIAGEDDEPTIIEWRAERVGGHKPTTDPHGVDWDSPDFTHPDREVLEHWVLHQQMRNPGVLYEIYQIESTLREVI